MIFGGLHLRLNDSQSPSPAPSVIEETKFVIIYIWNCSFTDLLSTGGPPSSVCDLLIRRVFCAVSHLYFFADRIGSVVLCLMLKFAWKRDDTVQQ